MIESIMLYWETLLEVHNFPGWELYIFLQTILWISVIFRLHRIEREVTND